MQDKIRCTIITETSGCNILLILVINILETDPPPITHFESVQGKTGVYDNLTSVESWSEKIEGRVTDLQLFLAVVEQFLTFIAVRTRKCTWCNACLDSCPVSCK